MTVLSTGGTPEPADGDTASQGVARLRGRWLWPVIGVLAVALVAGSWWTSRTDKVDVPAAGASKQAIKTGDPNEVESTGKQLARVVEPPERTITVVQPPKSGETIAFAVAFHPYGVGPNGTIAVKLDSIEAEPGAASVAAGMAKSLAGRNALVTPLADVAAVVDTGGSFRGRITVEINGGRGVLVLRSASAE